MNSLKNSLIVSLTVGALVSLTSCPSEPTQNSDSALTPEATGTTSVIDEVEVMSP